MHTAPVEPARPSPSRVALGVVAWAAAEPGLVAVTDDDGSFTFAELDRWAGAVAGEVLEQIAGSPGAPVPVLVRSDRWSVAAVHALIRAGVAHVPLDVAVPAPVLAEMVARTGPPPLVLVVDPADVALGRTLAGAAPVVVVPEVTAAPVPPRPVDPAAVATVVFTSGSTGRPKGVVYDWSLWDARVDEAGIWEAAYPDGTRRVIAIRRPLHWIGGFGQLHSLAVGSAVVTSATPADDAPTLFAWAERHAITHLQIGPSVLFRRIDRWPAGRRLTSVRSVAFGGEGSRFEQLATLRAIVAPDAVLMASYGASEGGGIRVTTMEFGPADPLGTGPIPLGRPSLPDRVAFVPVGDEPDAPDALREIVVRGAVAVGYLDDPDLTAAAFGVDPDGTRWWRSGDLVRTGPDGTTVMVARVDDVVKVNGALVAPAESERVLAELPGVAEVAVVARTDDRGPRLVAHVVPDGRAPVDPEMMLAACRARLAPHVIPRFFVRHERLPMLAIGKPDRVALRDLAPVPWRDAPAREPGHAVEGWCLATAREIVGLDALGPDDDLWASGLDSLLAVELCAAIAEAGHGDVEPAVLLEYPTVATLSAALRNGDATGRSGPTVFHSPGGLAPVVVVPPGGVTPVKFRWLALGLGRDRPVVVVESRGLRDGGPAARTVDALARDALDGIVPWLVEGAATTLVAYSASGPVAYEMAQRLVAAGRAAQVVLLDSAPAFEGSTWARGAGVRGSGLRGLPAAVVRSLRFHLASVAAHRRAPVVADVDTGPEPEPEPAEAARYAKFSARMFVAGVRYRPAPPTFPVTLFAVAGSEVVDRCTAVVPDAVVVEVPGDHGSMLDERHAPDLARRIGAVVEAFESSR